jgi:hypothetical protein
MVHFSLGWGLGDPETWKRLRAIYGTLPIPEGPPGLGGMWCRVVRHVAYWYADCAGVARHDEDFRRESFHASHVAILQCVEREEAEDFRKVYDACKKANRGLLRPPRWVDVDVDECGSKLPTGIALSGRNHALLSCWPVQRIFAALG